MISSRNRVRANLYVGACLHLNLCVHARVCIALGVCVVLFASCVSRQWMSSPLLSMSRWERQTARDAAPRSPPLDSQRNRAQRRRTSRPGVSSFCSWIGVTVALLTQFFFFYSSLFFLLSFFSDSGVKTEFIQCWRRGWVVWARGDFNFVGADPNHEPIRL